MIGSTVLIAWRAGGARSEHENRELGDAGNGWVDVTRTLTVVPVGEHAEVIMSACLLIVPHVPDPGQ